MQEARKDTAQHQAIAMLVNVTEFDGDILKVHMQGAELKTDALLRDSLLFWKRPFCRWPTQQSKEALLWSTFCPSNLVMLCPPCFWDPAVGLSFWLTPGQISVAWGCHCHWEWQGNSKWSQAAAWNLLFPARKTELWTQLSPADLTAFITTLEKRWKDHYFKPSVNW